MKRSIGVEERWGSLLSTYCVLGGEIAGRSLPEEAWYWGWPESGLQVGPRRSLREAPVGTETMGRKMSLENSMAGGPAWGWNHCPPR